MRASQTTRDLGLHDNYFFIRTFLDYAKHLRFDYFAFFLFSYNYFSDLFFFYLIKLSL